MSTSQLAKQKQQQKKSQANQPAQVSEVQDVKTSSSPAPTQASKVQPVKQQQQQQVPDVPEAKVSPLPVPTPVPTQVQKNVVPVVVSETTETEGGTTTKTYKEQLTEKTVDELLALQNENAKTVQKKTSENTLIAKELLHRLALSNRKSKNRNGKKKSNGNTGFIRPKDVPQKFVDFVNTHRIKYDVNDVKLHVRDGENVVLDESGNVTSLVDVDASGFIKLDNTKMYPRTLITHILYMYVNQNNLHAENAKYINANADLKKLLMMGKVEKDPVDKEGNPKKDKQGNLVGPFVGEDEVLEFTNFQIFVSRVYNEAEKAKATQAV